MSAMRNLDLILKANSMDNSEYELNKELVTKHLAGELTYDQLTQRLKDALMEWEAEECELRSLRNPMDEAEWNEVEPW